MTATAARPTVKCLVWDLDDTLWDGVVLEGDAPPPFPRATTTLKTLDSRGILHAAASRGDHDTATAHLDATRLGEWFCAARISWGDKSAAVRHIAETLNIGLDTVAFIDNDPAERAEVLAALPMVRCYPADLAGQLPELPEFRPAHVTAEAAGRRLLYRTEWRRRQAEEESGGDRRAFLASLDLVMEIAPATGRHLAKTLPDYMVPAQWAVLAALPLTRNGKPDRAALPEPAPVSRPHTPPGTTGPGESAAPRTAREHLLLALFAELLHAPAIGVHDGFFDSGGDSIIAIQLVSRAYEAGLRITVNDLFRAPTVAGLATRAEAVGPPAPAAAGPDDDVGPLPPTPIVHWWRGQDGDLDTFSQHMVVRTPAGLTTGRLTAALQALVDRHAALRMSLDPTGGEWRLDGRPAGRIRVDDRVRHLPAPATSPPLLPPDALDEALGRLAPTEGHLLSAAFLDRGPDATGRLLFVVHHLAVDGVSWRILLSDLAAADRALAAGETPELITPPVTFPEWARTVRAQGMEGTRRAELPLWTH